MNGRAESFPGGAGEARRDPSPPASPEGEFRALADSLPDLVVQVDAQQRVLYVNRAAREAFAPEADTFPGQPLSALASSSPWLAAFREAATQAASSGAERPFRFDAVVHGSSRNFEGRALPQRSAEGRVAGILGLAHDATSHTRESQQRALAHERQARESAESATLARDQFLAIVSHELRSPLNGIKSWTHVLENHLREPDPVVRRALGGIMIGVEHQVRLIEDLLDVTRAMGGQLGLVKLPVALGPVVIEAVEALRATALEKGVRLEARDALGEAEIHGDRDRLRQVFVNLVTNAVKFTPAEGRIVVTAEASGTMARIEVRDTGAGIPPEFLPYVFDPFRQANSGYRRGQDGLGLGLALAHRLVELHGGYVSCESDGAGKGATFRVYLPLRRDTGLRLRGEAKRAEPSPAEGTRPTLTGIHVLVIDDQREARESLSTLLSQAGASVATAASGQEAMAHLALSDGHGDEVILCDIAMPGEDGYATLRRIRAWESSGARAGRPHRPAVALSAFAQREDRTRALEAGFQVHLTKPVVPAELLTVIAKAARPPRP